MAYLVISNFSHFKKHLEDGLHSVRPGENVEALLTNNAIFNKENLPSRWKKGIDATEGFKITPIYTIKVVYIPTQREDTIIGISAYPSFDPRQMKAAEMTVR